MARYRVGRNTVREAIQSLRTLGLVDIRPRLGARVLGQAAPNTLANSAVSMLIGAQTVTELYEVRLILEPAAAAIAAKHRSDDDLLAMRRARTHYRVAYEMGTPVWEADIEFHQAIAEASGNAVLAKVLAPVSDLLNNARRATGTLPAAVEIALGQHDEIADAIEARAATACAPRHDATHRIGHLGGQPTQRRRASHGRTAGDRIGRLSPRPHPAAGAPEPRLPRSARLAPHRYGSRPREPPALGSDAAAVATSEGNVLPARNRNTPAATSAASMITKVTSSPVARARDLARGGACRSAPARARCRPPAARRRRRPAARPPGPASGRR